MVIDKYITFEQMRKILEDHLKIALKVEDFDITYAKRGNFEEREQWRVNVEFKKDKSTAFSDTALFALDAKTGEVQEFKKNMFWKF